MCGDGGDGGSGDPGAGAANPGMAAAAADVDAAAAAADAADALAAIDPTVSVTPANQAMGLVTATETAAAATAAANAAATESAPAPKPPAPRPSYKGLSSFVTTKSGISDTKSDIASKESQTTSSLFSPAQSKSTTQDDDLSHPMEQTSLESVTDPTEDDTQDETTDFGVVDIGGLYPGTSIISLDPQTAMASHRVRAEIQEEGKFTLSGRTKAGLFSDDDEQSTSLLGFFHSPKPSSETGTTAAQQENLDSLDAMTALGLISEEEAFEEAGKDISKGGLGRFSPAVTWGVNSETGKATFADLAALNYSTTDPTRGYEINEPQPTDAGVAASYTLGQLNPTAAAGLMAIGSMVPGPAGFVGSLASAMNPNPGLLSALADEIGFETPSFLDPVTGLLDDITDTVTDVAGQALTGVFGFANEALDATLGELATAATEGLDSIGLGSTEEAGTGFDADAFGGVDGGGPDPDAQPATPPPPPPAPEPRSTAPVVAVVDTFLDTSATTPLVSIPDIATPTLGVDEDLGVAPMMTTLPRRSSFRRSRVTSARDRAFGAANLFRPTLSAGISL
jgi:hypothetical protein